MDNDTYIIDDIDFMADSEELSQNEEYRHLEKLEQEELGRIL